jgi:hypothetical protein
MDTSYYSRARQTNSDGTAVFQNEEDQQKELQIAKTLEQKWKCEIHKFSPLSPIDFYAVRDGRVKCLIELKARNILSTAYETIFLSVRKWLSLMLSATGLGVPAIFCVQFQDATKWVNVSTVDASKIQISGCKNYGTRSGKQEPLILVPIKQMEAL